DPNLVAHETLYGVLNGQMAQHKRQLDASVKDILAAEIKVLTANRMSQESTETTKELPADQRTVDDAFRTAVRAFGSAVANGYAKTLALAESKDEDDFDIFTAKATIAGLLAIPGVVDAADKA